MLTRTQNEKNESHWKSEYIAKGSRLINYKTSVKVRRQKQ